MSSQYTYHFDENKLWLGNLTDAWGIFSTYQTVQWIHIMFIGNGIFAHLLQRFLLVPAQLDNHAYCPRMWVYTSVEIIKLNKLTKTVDIISLQRRLLQKTYHCR